MDRLKILHVFKTYLPDSFTGIERVIWNIAEAGMELGLESHVFSLSRTPLPSPRPIGGHLAHYARLDVYRASTGFSLSAPRAFRELARQVDLIHYHFPWPMMDLMHLCSGTRTPAILTYHSDIVRQRWLMRLYRPLMTRFLAAMQHVVATSPNYARTSPVLQAYIDKLSVVPIGIDAARAAPGAEALARWRQRVGEGFFLFLGAARYYKGLDFLFAAAQRSGLEVVLAGKSTSLDTQAIERAIPNIRFVGPVSEEDKEALLALCTAFVLPSHLRSEAFGVVLLEAARAGKPMISCAMGTGTSYVNLDGVTGLTVPPGDSAALAAAMTALYADPDRCRAMGEAAERRFHSEFTARIMAERYAALYRRYAATGRHG